jgi:CRISPR-associated endonuclease/helicase Cas3
VLGRVAAGLRAYAPEAGGDLLWVTRMRGGTTWASAWLDRPDRPGIVLGTVDQVGSRLLFRGYGVTDRRRPIDAAFAGTDSLLLVDEAHLATALTATVAAAQDRDRVDLPVPATSVVRLSATGEPSTSVFTLDVEAHRGHDEAWARLTAGKTLRCAVATASNCDSVLAATVLDEVRRLEAERTGGYAPTALVVCNTVDRARAVHARLEKALSSRRPVVQADCDLLIGRSRPLDRPTLQARTLRRFGIGRAPADRAAILVATQTIEVGINLDADVLVSESASWDALVQRLGRLNRLGRFTERFPSQPAAPAVVVHDGRKDGPVYGAARDMTWAHLEALVAAETAGLDVSPLACRRLSTGPLGHSGCIRLPAGVPILQGPTLDAWTQTAPVPLNDPPIQEFLHGFDSGAAAVQVGWRDGLLSGDPLDDPFGADGAEQEAGTAGALLAAVPVRAPELVEIPFTAVRQWLLGQIPEPVSDLETAPPADGKVQQAGEPFRALAWRTDHAGVDRRSGAAGSWRWIEAAQLRPGDRIVVPSERGGLDEYGWSPADHQPVADISEAATFVDGRGRREAALRLDGGLPSRLGLTGEQLDRAVAAITAATGVELLDDPTGDRVGELRGALADGMPKNPPTGRGWSAEAWAALRSWTRRPLRVIDITDVHAAPVAGAEPPVLARLLVGPLSRPDTQEPADAVDRDDDEVAASSVSANRVTLARHLTAARDRAVQIADAIGLPQPLRKVVADAAGWHDLGKVEERFQTMLHGGDSYQAVLAVEPLAKSGMDPADRLGWRWAQRASGLPAGARHEAWSAALIQEYLQGAGSAYPWDADLLVHLVASHHGHARPFLPLVADPDARPVSALVGGHKVTISSDRTVSLEHPARFARLNERYGRWGLALLESIVRCADMTVSAEGS